MPPQVTQSGYWEQIYQGPWKGIASSVPENMIPDNMSPSISNFVLKNAELRTRARMSIGILGTQDNYPIDVIDTFQDGNTVYHTVMVNRSGLWQLNPNFSLNPLKAWNRVGTFPVQPGPDIPTAHATFLNKFYWTNGDNNLWVWDGITSVGAPVTWKANQLLQLGFTIVDSNGFVQVVTTAGYTGATEPLPAGVPPGHWNQVVGGATTEVTVFPKTPVTWTNNGKPGPVNGFSATAMVDANNGISAGAFFVGILAARMLLLSTVEGPAFSGGGQPFTQRIRWCASGQPNIWDPNINIGAGFIDLLEVPDAISGFLAIGDKTGFVFRTNGISEMTSVSDGILPFDFNHLWASDRGIGNVYPFSISGYGPIGMFIASDDIYNISIGGFKNVGGPAREAIFSDLANASSTPLSTMIPKWSNRYAYLSYLLAIPFGPDTRFWMYALEDSSWTTWVKRNVIVTGRANFVATR
jgi:hypothetical protein